MISEGTLVWNNFPWEELGFSWFCTRNVLTLPKVNEFEIISEEYYWAWNSCTQFLGWRQQWKLRSVIKKNRVRNDLYNYSKWINIALPSSHWILKNTHKKLGLGHCTKSSMEFAAYCGLQSGFDAIVKLLNIINFRYKIESKCFKLLWMRLEISIMMREKRLSYSELSTT